MPRPLLVLAAHPDDETIGAARLLLRSPAACVVFLTDGAPRAAALRPAGPDDQAAYARRRRAEALAALAEARVPAGDVVFLGGVDQEAAGELASLARELARVLSDVRPRLVVTHPYEGGHPDHDCAAVAARAAAALVARDGRRAPPLAEMTSYHRRDGAVVRAGFLPGGPPAVTRVLDADERRRKAAMDARYETQREVLAPFPLEVERYRRGPPLDPRARPHEGNLHYEALGWASFDAVRAPTLAALRALGLGETGWA
jgi:LmbE family N-acetylglucosaminyl deacetylase